MSCTSPCNSVRADTRVTPRSVQAIASTAVTMPPAAPISSDVADGCSVSAVVPTAPTHHVRSPSMIAAAYPIAPATPIALPAIARYKPSIRTAAARAPAYSRSR